MPKWVRNSSMTSRSGARRRPYARSFTLISAIAITIGPQARCRGWSSGGIVSRPWQEVGLAPRAGSVERVVYHPVQPPVIEAPDVRKDLAREAAATFLIGAQRHP